jgi:hypothetical protein
MKINKDIGLKGMKYEIVKTILMIELSKQTKRHWLDLYSEFEYDEKTICSVYLMDSKRKNEVIYQITDKLNLEIYESFLRTGGKVIQIKLKDMPDDIYEIRNKIIEIING